MIGLVWFDFFVLCGLSKVKSIIFKEQRWYYLTDNFKKKRSRSFSNGITRKLNIIVRQEIELGYYGIKMQYVSHHAWKSPSTGKYEVTRIDIYDKQLISLSIYHLPKAIYIYIYSRS